MIDIKYNGNINSYRTIKLFEIINMQGIKKGNNSSVNES